MQDSKINPLWKVLNENHNIKLPSDKDYTCINTGIDNSTDTESAAPNSEKVFASDFDKIVSEGKSVKTPNPAPLEDEKK